MTSRVQKGGTLFRPVAKVRSLASASNRSRQSSLSIAQSNPAGIQHKDVEEPTNITASISLSSVSSDVSPSGGDSSPEILRSSQAQSHAIHHPSSRCPPRLCSGRQTSTSPKLQAVSLGGFVDPPFASIISDSFSQPPVQREAESQGPINKKAATVGEHLTTQPISNESSLVFDPQTPQRSSACVVEDGEGLQTQGKRFGDKAKGKRKKTGIGSQSTEGAEEVDGQHVPKKSRATSSGSRARSRALSVPPLNPMYGPGEEIDPNVVTMASLCRDTGIGRVSSKAAEILTNHANWKARNRERRARLKSIMEAKKYGREDPEAADGENPVDNTTADLRQVAVVSGTPAVTTPAVLDESGSGFDYTEGLSTSRFNVQVRIGPNGETIIDEESLVIDRAEPENVENYTHVVESESTKFVNSGSYGKRYRGSRWSAEETELFYNALSQYGENYELIAYVLPGRDRKSCKNKFKIEDRRNPARVNYCLNHSTPIDMQTLSRMTGRDFSGPIPEIRAPTPRVTETPVVEKPDSSAEPSPGARKARKRSRSRASAADDAVVVGDVDQFPANTAE